MAKVQFVVTLNFTDGTLDTELLEANLVFALQKAQDEGAITPDRDDHGMLVDIDILPRGIVD